MQEIKNNILFTFNDTDLIVPIREPWNIYQGEPKQEPDYYDVVNRETDPPFFVIHLTEKCNLKCKYCFEGEKGVRNMNEDTVEKLILFIKKNEYKKFTIRFFGGEPTMNLSLMKYILDRMDEEFPDAEGYEKSYNLFTNAVSIPDELIDMVKKWKIGCFVSMDGVKPMHDRNRIFSNGMGSYDIVKKNALKLQEACGQIVMIRAIYDTGSVEESIVDIVDSCDKEGFRLISIEFPWVGSASDMALNAEKTDRIIEMISEYADECINRMKEDDFSLLILYEIFKHISKVAFQKTVLYSEVCSAGSTLMSIDVNGDIYPCHSFIYEPEWKLGNLEDGITNKELMEKFKNSNSDTLDMCIKCPIRYYCTKRCFADSVMREGRIDAFNENRCRIEKAFYEAAMYIFWEIKKHPTLLTKMRLMIWDYWKMEQYR